MGDNTKLIVIIATAATVLINIFTLPFTILAPYLQQVIEFYWPGYGAISIARYHFVDSFIPPTELCGLVALWIPIYLFFTTVRVIKSLLPFIAT